MTTTAPKLDLTGARFGRLTAVECVGKVGQAYRWRCRCDCGGESVVRTALLRDGTTKSCGCLQREKARQTRYKHGQTGTPEFRAWAAMIGRCGNPNDKAYPDYGGRGIRVCERWRGEDGFANFLSDVGPRPSPAHSLDRIEVNGHYEPGNCRWASRSVQNNNTRKNRFVTYGGKTQTLAQWAREYTMSRCVLRQRLALGWDFKRAVSTPVNSRSIAA